MKRFVLILFVFFTGVSFGQMKSDLDVLLPYEKNSVISATNFGDAFCSGFLICYRVLRYENEEGKTRFVIEFKNESETNLSFRYCISENENAYKNISNWKQIINLSPNEKKNTGVYVSHLTNSIWISVGAVKKGINSSLYEYEGINSDVNNTTICAYCAINSNNDEMCPKGEIDESVYQELLMEGYEYTETELGKIKGTIPLTEGEKNNAKIDLAVQGVNLLFKLGRDIKKNKEEKREKERQEQAELLLQQQQETKRRNDEIAIKQKINTPKIEEKINVSDVTFKDFHNNQPFLGGQIIFKDGSYYFGNLKDYKKSDGKINKGIFFFSNGDKYEGGFTNQKQDGWGTYTWANGQKFTGYFSNGDILGIGTMTFKNNTYKTGYFKRTSDNMGMNFDDEATKVHQTYRSSDGTQLWQIKSPIYISEL